MSQASHPRACLETGNLDTLGRAGVWNHALLFKVFLFFLFIKNVFVMTHNFIGIRIIQLLASGEPLPLEYCWEYSQRPRAPPTETEEMQSGGVRRFQLWVAAAQELGGQQSSLSHRSIS